MKSIFGKIAPLLVLAFLFGDGLYAQVGNYNRKVQDVFPDQGNYAPKGWYFTPGITQTIGFENSQRTDLGGDTLRIQHEEPAGQMGAFLQVGRFHVLKSRWINYLDYGVDLRWLRGLHSRRVETRLGADNPEWIEQSGQGSFSDLWLGATVNATFARSLSNTVFITHSLGVNANYAVVRQLNYAGAYEGTRDYSPPVVSAQLHYKLGIGFQLGRGWYLMPTIETPILGIYAWNDAIPSLKYLDTYYQPILIGVQIMKRDRKKAADCPPEGPSGRDRRKNTELWDKKMRR